MIRGFGWMLAFLAVQGWAAPGRWSSEGPYGGRVDSAIASPLQANNLYATSHRSVYRSVDGGASWILASAGLNTIEEDEAVVIAHPTIAGRLMLAGARGVFRTDDSGRSWQRSEVGLPVSNANFRTVDIAYVPQDGNKLYVVTKDHGLYRSSDGGLSWSSGGGTTLPQALNKVAADPNNLGTVLVWAGARNTTTFPASLYRSLDFGVNFTPITGPWDSGGPIQDELELLAYNGNVANSIFLAGEFGAFRSINNLAFTSLAPLLPSATQRLQSIASDPTTPGRAIFGTSEGVLITATNGNGFSARNTGLNINGVDAASIGPVIIDPSNTARWLAFSVSGEVFVTTNAGSSWTSSSFGLRGTDVESLSVQPGRPQRLLAGVRNDRSEATSPALFLSDNFGASWVRSNSNLLLDTVQGITHDPANLLAPASVRVYAVGADFAPLGLPTTSYRGGIFVSGNSGVSWAPADTLIPVPAGGPSRLGVVRQLIVDPTEVAGFVSQNLYFVNDGRVSCAGVTPSLSVARVWRSVNGATSWAPADNLPLGTCTPNQQYPRPFHISFDPSTPTRVIVGTRIVGYDPDVDPLPTIPNGLFRSTNNGVTWSPINDGLPRIGGGTTSPWDVTALIAVPGTSGTLLVAVQDPSDEDIPGRIYKSVNGGGNWTRSDTGIVGKVVRSLRVDPLTPQRIIAGAAGVDTSPGGVYVSENGGDSWLSVSIGMPIDSAAAVAISRPSAAPPTLHAGTGEGVFSLTRVPDDDSDGPSDEVENLAPNVGDGNGDNVLDRLQPDVASFGDSVGTSAAKGGKSKQGTLSDIELLLGDGNCEQLVDAHFVDIDELPSDPQFSPFPLAIRFEHVECLNATMQLILHGEDLSSGQWVLRRYGPLSVGNPLTLQWHTVNGAQFISPNRVRFPLVDNATGDLRSEASRVLYIVVPARVSDVFANGFESP